MIINTISSWTRVSGYGRDAVPIYEQTRSSGSSRAAVSSNKMNECSSECSSDSKAHSCGTKSFGRSATGDTKNVPTFKAPEPPKFSWAAGASNFVKQAVDNIDTKGIEGIVHVPTSPKESSKATPVVPEEPKITIFGLPAGTHRDDVYKLITRELNVCKGVRSIVVKTSGNKFYTTKRDEGKAQCFAHVSFFSPEDAEATLCVIAKGFGYQHQILRAQWFSRRFREEHKEELMKGEALAGSCPKCNYFVLPSDGGCQRCSVDAAWERTLSILALKTGNKASFPTLSEAYGPGGDRMQKLKKFDVPRSSTRRREGRRVMVNKVGPRDTSAKHKPTTSKPTTNKPTTRKPTHRVESSERVVDEDGFTLVQSKSKARAAKAPQSATTRRRRPRGGRKKRGGKKHKKKGRARAMANP